MAAIGDHGRDSRDTARIRDSIRVARAVLRFLDKGRIDKARRALMELLDMLGKA
jgi:hypothetical protein